MELEAIKQMVQKYPHGVQIRMVDGKVYKIPHRDFLSFGAPKEMMSGKLRTTGTSFIVFERGDIASFCLVNALLVAEVVPYQGNGNGKNGHVRKKK